jgi:hypothetical protein
MLHSSINKATSARQAQSETTCAVTCKEKTTGRFTATGRRECPVVDFNKLRIRPAEQVPERQQAEEERFQFHQRRERSSLGSERSR